MSGGHGGGGGGSSLKLLFAEVGLVVIGLWVIWFFSGGPQRAAQQGDMPFLQTPDVMGGSGQVYDANGNTAPIK